MHHMVAVRNVNRRSPRGLDGCQVRGSDMPTLSGACGDDLLSNRAPIERHRPVTGDRCHSRRKLLLGQYLAWKWRAAVRHQHTHGGLVHEPLSAPSDVRPVIFADRLQDRAQHE